VSEIVDRIKAPINEEMNAPLLDKITHYIVKRKGKQLRPMFVFLCAKAVGEVNDNTYTAASLVELLHTATLVHDDVVDDSNARRGFFSLNALWKNKIAVLVGDYLLSQGLLMSVENGQFELLRIVSRAVKEMSEGELLQIEKTRGLNLDEDTYFKIIRQKTASLIASCCEAGASSSTEDKETIEQMRLFGEYCGIAFQIKDDIFDYGTAETIGKPTGIDIKEKKVTLPLLHSINNAEKGQRRKIIRLLKNGKGRDRDIQHIMDFVRSSGGLEHAASRMMEYRDKSLAVLAGLPETPARASLIELVNYTVERKK